MPIFAMTANTKRNGLQTFRRASLLNEPLREVELEYLSVRDRFCDLVAYKDQFAEALHQAKAAGDEPGIKEFGNKIRGVEDEMIDLKQRVRLAGERSWAEAFHLVARSMLPKEVIRVLDEEANRLIGRGRHELKASKKGASKK